MAQYNVEVRTRGSVLDTTKVESADLKGLRVEVARFVGRLLADHAEQIWVDEDWRVDGTDEKGLILFSLHLFATDSAATMYQKRQHHRYRLRKVTFQNVAVLIRDPDSHKFLSF